MPAHPERVRRNYGPVTWSKDSKELGISIRFVKQYDVRHAQDYIDVIDPDGTIRSVRLQEKPHAGKVEGAEETIRRSGTRCDVPRREGHSSVDVQEPDARLRCDEGEGATQARPEAEKRLNRYGVDVDEAWRRACAEENDRANAGNEPFNYDRAWRAYCQMTNP